MGLQANAITVFADQQFSTIGGGHLVGIGDGEAVGQTFTPTQTDVVALSVNTYSVYGTGTPMTAKILSGNGGTVIASENFTIPVGFGFALRLH